MQTTAYLTLHEAARALNMSEARLEHYAFRGDMVPVFRTIGGIPIFDTEDVYRLGRQLGKLPKEITP